MKRTIYTLLFLLLTFTGFSQFKHLAESAPFEEPETGFAKVLQMKNGNTIYLHINIKEGIEVKIFDSLHRSKVSKMIEPKYNRSKNKSIESVFEINGNVVLMVNEADDRIPVLYRIIIDGTTGSILQDEKIAELKKVTMGQGYAMVFGRVPKPDFFVRKDPDSDYYGLILLNSFESDRNKRLEVVWYGPDNKEISRAFYLSPDDRYKYLNYIDMAVIGNQKISVLAYAYNTAASGGKESELVIGNLDAGAKAVTLAELPFSVDLIFNYGRIRYNPVTKDLLLLAAVQVGKKSNQYGTILAFIDPVERKVIRSRSIFPEKVSAQSEELFGRKHGYNGVPQNIFVNTDGSFTIVYEEIVNVTQSGSDYSMSYNELGNVAVCKYDPEGKELQSYLMPKNHRVYGYHLQPFYHSEREGSATQLLSGNQYKSFAYLDGKKDGYLLFNDIEKNGETMQKGRITTIQSVKECDGFYFPLNGKGLLPERKFVFGRPDSKKEHQLALFAISDYDRERNIYSTIELDKEGRSKDVKVVWLRPE
ncbi:MAG TPA: hypothetical protein VNS58_22060 [Puia sp.]|nr:hypothetical protein [Puia sp.]